jgi:uncharacterized protein (TIGR02594 family)
MKYNFLKSLQVPKIVSEGMRLMGTLETPGKANNPMILSWAKETGIIYNADEIPWCGLFVAVVVKRSGRQIVEDPLWALSWRKFGKPSPVPGLGDILTFKRNGGGHVGVYIAEDPIGYHVLGGNQSDKVSIVRISKNRFVEARRPVYITMPESVKPYVLQPSGEFSNNEL